MSPPRSSEPGRAPAPLIDSGARPAAHKGSGAGLRRDLRRRQQQQQRSALLSTPLPTPPASSRQSLTAPSAPPCQVRRTAPRSAAKPPPGCGCCPAWPGEAAGAAPAARLELAVGSRVGAVPRGYSERKAKGPAPAKGPARCRSRRSGGGCAGAVRAGSHEAGGGFER